MNFCFIPAIKPNHIPFKQSFVPSKGNIDVILSHLAYFNLNKYTFKKFKVKIDSCITFIFINISVQKLEFLLVFSKYEIQPKISPQNKIEDSIEFLHYLEYKIKSHTFQTNCSRINVQSQIHSLTRTVGRFQDSSVKSTFSWVLLLSFASLGKKQILNQYCFKL